MGGCGMDEKWVATLALAVDLFPALAEISITQQPGPSAIACDSFARDYAANDAWIIRR
jgi:hypothetical protein